MNRMILLSGPSCIGKSPLCKALQRFNPELMKHWQTIVIINSRQPRPGETDGVDYYFKTRHDIESLRDRPGFLVRQVRNDLQAVDVREVQELLGRGDVFFEGNPVIAAELRRVGLETGAHVLSVFLAPLSREEILFLQDPARNVDMAQLVKEMMQRKLLRRAKTQKTNLSIDDLRDIDARASSAYNELKCACEYDAVIPNHDGEDSENWDAFYYPLGDARKTFHAFLQLLEGAPCPHAEHWEADLLR